MVHAHRAVVLVEPGLVVRQKVDPQEHGTELAEVGDVALHVFLRPVAGGVHPLQQPAAVEVVVRVDDVGHLDFGPADDGDGWVRDRGQGGPQGVVVDAELHSLALEVVGPPGPVVLPVVRLAHDVAVRGDLLGVVDPPVGADHGVAVVAERLGHPVDVGLPDGLGDECVRHVLVVVGAPVQGPGSTGSESGDSGGCLSRRRRPRTRCTGCRGGPDDVGGDGGGRQTDQHRPATALEHLASRRHQITPRLEPRGSP